MKKVHMMKYGFLNLLNWADTLRPVCKVHNKTWAFKQTFKWKEVTCLRCLERKGK